MEIVDKTAHLVKCQRIRIAIALLLLVPWSRFALADNTPGKSSPPAPDVKIPPAVPMPREAALRQEAEKLKRQPSARTVYGTVSSIRTSKLSKEGFRLKLLPDGGDEHYPHYRLSIVANGPDGVGMDLPHDTAIRIVPENKAATVTVTRNVLTGLFTLHPDKGNLVLTIFKDNEDKIVSKTVLAANFFVTRTAIRRWPWPGTLTNRPIKPVIRIIKEIE